MMKKTLAIETSAMPTFSKLRVIALMQLRPFTCYVKQR